ncbi:hypothetical protein BGZ63DRAFT_451817 [Mariannaea sp. PMI_226]|nr:hypothetical protein BGZ63DRAFT_451817 [Mariannaea sp. PMI_226]
MSDRPDSVLQIEDDMGSKRRTSSEHDDSFRLAPNLSSHSGSEIQGERVGSEQQAEPVAKHESTTDRAQFLRRIYNQSHYSGYTPDIAVILEEGVWRHCGRDIIRFCRAHFAHMTWNDLDESTQAAFTEMTPKACGLMEDKVGRIALFAARFWRVVDEAIFKKKKADLLEWEHPYFKYQDAMVKEIRKHHPGELDIYQTGGWRWWEYLSYYFYANIVDKEYQLKWGRIRLSCFRKIIAHGIGPAFPEELEANWASTLNEIGKVFLAQEAKISSSEFHHYLLFAHPTTLQTSGFPFDAVVPPVIWEDSMVEFHRELGQAEAIDLQGHQVDLIVSPFVMTVDVSRGKDLDPQACWSTPIVVYIGGIKSLDREETKEEETEEEETEEEETEEEETEEEETKEEEGEKKEEEEKKKEERK